MMRVSIIAIGDELLIGQVVDTNSGEIARMLQPHGWKVNDVQVVGDSAKAIKQAVRRAFELSDVVLTTGGIGPTRDDITKKTLCDIFGGVLKLDVATLENVQQVVAKRHLTLNPLTAAQAMVPTCCTVIQNSVGTAPIMWFENDGKVLVSMPGVPFETRQMFSAKVLPLLLDRFRSREVMMSTNTIVTGYTESEVAQMLERVENSLPTELHLAYLPKPGIIRLRLDATGQDEVMLRKMLDSATNKIIDTIGESHVLSRDDRDIAGVIHDTFAGSGLTIATAESCTGGNIARTITSVPGSSEYFLGSVVAYSNEVKAAVLGVDPELINRHGAVSEPVAVAMAQGAARVTGASCAVATTGIAGPGGAVDGKPVGTVCVAVLTPDGVEVTTYQLPGTRDRVIDRATTNALVTLAQKLRR